MEKYDVNNALDNLASNENSTVRAAVAEQGCCLDKLVNDSSSAVRCAVAGQGYGLCKLIDDTNELVKEVAKTKLKEANDELKNLVYFEILDKNGNILFDKFDDFSLKLAAMSEKDDRKNAYEADVLLSKLGFDISIQRGYDLLLLAEDY